MSVPRIDPVARSRAMALFRLHKTKNLPEPTIGPGPDCADLYWNNPAFTLLITVPADPNEPAMFYGDQGGAGQNSVRGEIPVGQVSMKLMAWIIDRTTELKRANP